VSEYAWVFGAGSLLLAFLTFYGGWVLARYRGESAAKDAKEALAKIDAARAELHARIDSLNADLAAFKEHVARDYASNRMIEQMEARLVAAINRLGDRLDRAFDRVGKE
jgi:predicted nuclease with TOPRIM domain